MGTDALLHVLGAGLSQWKGWCAAETKPEVLPNISHPEEEEPCGGTHTEGRGAAGTDADTVSRPATASACQGC